MSILTAPIFPVKSAPPAVPTVAERALGDRLAHSADGNDPADYRPGWDDDRYEPSVEDRYYERGLAVGRAGDNCTAFDAFPDDRGADWVAGERSFYLGLLSGRRLYAEQVGYDLGLAGEPCERPARVHRRFDKQFALGWGRGSADFAARDAAMAAYFQELDYDHAYEMEMREVEAFNHRMFYDRRPASMVD